MHLNGVLLPDRTVLVCGGALQREARIVGRLQAEIYDPATDSWSIAAASSIPRLYHSIALLLPDGRVVAGGGNPQGGSQVEWVPPDPDEELRLDVYSPPYLFRGERPVIDGTDTNLLRSAVRAPDGRRRAHPLGQPHPARHHHALL